MKLNHYLIMSPPITIQYTEYDPPETYPEICQIQARNKSEAKVLALKHPDMKRWIKWCRLDNENPLAGLKVSDMRCNHGFCWCDECTKNGDVECFECQKEAEEREKKLYETSRTTMQMYSRN